jgi:hypothetical protein
MSTGTPLGSGFGGRVIVDGSLRGEAIVQLRKDGYHGLRRLVRATASVQNILIQEHLVGIGDRSE